MHKLTVENCETALLSGVSEVTGFDDKQVCFIVGEKSCEICGASLKIDKFDKENGALSVSGEIVRINYAAKTAPLLKRLFK